MRKKLYFNKRKQKLQCPFCFSFCNFGKNIDDHVDRCMKWGTHTHSHTPPHTPPLSRENNREKIRENKRDQVSVSE